MKPEDAEDQETTSTDEYTRNFTTVCESSVTEFTPPSSTDTEKQYDFTHELDESFQRSLMKNDLVSAKESIDKCNDLYLKSILSEDNNQLHLAKLYYCSMCDAPLYELSALIPDDSQPRELICHQCSAVDYENGNDDDECTVHIVDEMDITLQSMDDFDFEQYDTSDLTIIRTDGFDALINKLRTISMRDLKLRQSMNQIQSSESTSLGWELIRRIFPGSKPVVRR